MLIVLEGPDGAGKSTFANRLIRAFDAGKPTRPATVIHRGVMYPDADPVNEYLLDKRPGSFDLTVIDRWFPSELVYGPHYRGESRLTKSEAVWLDKVLDKQGALKLLLLPELYVLKKRLGARGDDMVDVSGLSALRGAYDRFGREFPGWAQLELTTKTPAEIMAVARRFARMSEPLTDQLLDGYIGPPNPKLLAIIKGSCNPQTIQVGRMANPLIGIVPAKYASNALIARLGNPKTTVIRGEEA